MTTIGEWLTAVDAFRLCSALAAAVLTIVELIDCRRDLKITGARLAERIVAQANFSNDVSRLIVCSVFAWLAISALVFPPSSGVHEVLFANRVAMLIGTFAVMYKSWRDRHLRRQLYVIWQRERTLRGRRGEDAK